MSTDTTLEQTLEQVHAVAFEAARGETTVLLDPLLHVFEHSIVDDPGHGDRDPFRSGSLLQDHSGSCRLSGLVP